MTSELTINQHLLTRLALQSLTNGTSHGGKRNLYDVFGYASSHTTEDFVARYSRGDIALRIVSAYPEATWKKAPEVIEDADTEDLTVFEKAFQDLVKSTRLFHYLNRADKLANLGEYSALLIGYQDGLALSQPCEKAAAGIAYLMPFADINATIQSYDLNPVSKRFGLPETYSIQTGGYSAHKSVQMPSSVITVHHSRILHIAAGCLDNDVLGMPILRPIMNQLVNLDKVIGGSAETFWLNSRGGLNANMETGIDFDPIKTKESIDEYTHQLTRFLLTQGMEVKTLDMQVHEPDKHVSVILDIISGATGIPKRILTGSERGELASSQDGDNWRDRVMERQINWVEPFVLNPLIDRFIEVGVLPKPISYTVKWNEEEKIDGLKASQIAVNRANAIATFANSTGGDLLVPVEQFVVEVLGLDYREDDLNKSLFDDRQDDDLTEDL